MILLRVMLCAQCASDYNDVCVSYVSMCIISIIIIDLSHRLSATHQFLDASLERLMKIEVSMNRIHTKFRLRIARNCAYIQPLFNHV